MSQGAVITADIVNSTKLSKTDMKKIMKNITLIFSNHKIEFFRGDSFQVYMKLPGEAWLEFSINKDNVLEQTATFRPLGLWGRIYWYAVFPFRRPLALQIRIAPWSAGVPGRFAVRLREQRERCRHRQRGQRQRRENSSHVIAPGSQSTASSGRSE